MNVHTKTCAAIAALTAGFLVLCATPFGMTHEHTPPSAATPEADYAATTPIGGHGADLDCDMLFVAPTSVDAKQPTTAWNAAASLRIKPASATQPLNTAAMPVLTIPAVSETSLFSQAVSFRI